MSYQLLGVHHHKAIITREHFCIAHYGSGIWSFLKDEGILMSLSQSMFFSRVKGAPVQSRMIL